MNYYNEFDPKAAAWLRELIKEGHIPDGYVDERSILDVRPHELTPYCQQHFFAGIGGWPLALKLASWPESRPVRTGSCPCQPFSGCGLGLGEADPRHLWPAFRDLITFGEATITFGEQVASAAGRIWLSRVRADLEALGYAVGAADLCSAGVGSPNIRQRLYWAAYTDFPLRDEGTRGWEQQICNDDDGVDRLADPHGRGCHKGRQSDGQGSDKSQSELGGQNGGLAHPDFDGFNKQCGNGRSENSSRASARIESLYGSDSSGLVDTAGERRCSGEPGSQDAGDARLAGQKDPPHEGDYWLGHADVPRPQRRRFDAREHGNQRTPWATSELIDCTDGKSRRIEPGTFPLAYGVSGRVGLLRGYGNAINPYVAAEFIQACEETHSAPERGMKDL